MEVPHNLGYGPPPILQIPFVNPKIRSPLYPDFALDEKFWKDVAAELSKQCYIGATAASHPAAAGELFVLWVLERSVLSSSAFFDDR